MPLEDVPRPPDNVVEKIYAEVLEQLAIPAATAEQLIKSESLQRKWQMIQMNGELISDDNMHSIRSWGPSDEALLHQLDQASRPDLDTIRQLKQRLSYANKQWLLGFFQSHGVHVLLRAMRKRLANQPRSDFDHAVLLESCEALKSTMNTTEGLDEVVGTDGAMETLAMCLDFTCAPLARLVLEILAVTCYFSRPELVQTAIQSLHRREMRAPYESLTSALVEADIAVKAKIITFLNTLINCTTVLDDRIVIRHYLLSQDITRICEQIIAEFDPVREAELYQDLYDAGASTHNTTSMALTLGPGGPIPSMSFDRTPTASMSLTAGPGGALDRGMSMRSTVSLTSEATQKAEDGKTPICPERGIMAGKGLTAKNKQNHTRQLVSSLLSMSKTKTRWYVLDGKNLSWTKLSGAKEDSTADPSDHDDSEALSLTKVIDIRPVSSDPDLIKATQFHFDIVTDARVYSIAVESEEHRLKWLMALRYAKEKARSQAGAAPARLRDTDILEPKVCQAKFEMFRKQVEVFTQCMAADLESTVKDVVARTNTSDAVSMFQYLMGELNTAGLGDMLLRLLHQLLFLPTDPTLGKDTWEVLQRVIYELRTFDRTRKTNLDAWLVHLDDMQTLMLAKRDLDAEMKRYRSLPEEDALKHSLVTIRQLEDEIKDLKATLAARPVRTITLHALEPPQPSEQDDAYSTDAHASPEALPAPAKPVHPLAAMLATRAPPNNAAEETTGGEAPARPVHPMAAMLKKKQDGDGDAAESSAKPVHPLAAMLATKKTAGPLAGAEGGEGESGARPVHPMAAMFKAKKPDGSGAEAAAGPSPPQRPVHPLAAALGGAKGGAPPPVNPKVGAAAKQTTEAPASPVCSLPPKPKVDPPQKMKGVYWNVLPPQKVSNTVWEHLNDYRGLDMSALLEDFAAKQDAPVKTAAASKTDAPKHVSLFDPKRNQNVLIGLGRFKATHEQIRVAVIGLSEAFLTAENTQKLLNIMPTAEEVATVHGFEGDAATLGPVETFFNTISTVPRLEQRLKTWLTTLTYDDSLQQLKHKLDVLHAGAMAVKNSKGFPKVLEIVLAVGNYMNGSSSRGGAYGFRLDALMKLQDVKAASRNKGTLLNFVAAQAEAKVPDCKDLVKQLMAVHDAAEHSLGQIESEAKAIEMSLNMVRHELEEMDILPYEVSAAFKTKVGRFMQRIQAPRADMLATLERVKGFLTEVMGSYGEDLRMSGDQDPVQRFFTLLSTFVNSYREALDANKKLAAEAAKKATAAGDGLSADNKQNLFSHFTAAQNQKTADEIVQEFKAKMAKRRQHLATPQEGLDEWVK